MKPLSLVILLVLMSSFLVAQEVSREQKFRQIADLNDQVKKILEDLLRPSSRDLQSAEAEGVKVFRLLPRTAFSGDGCFYSFTTGSHDYQKIAQIMLEGDALGTGFAGGDYGLMADLSAISLAGVNAEIPEVSFLLKYKAPTNILDARSEQRKRGNYVVDNFILKARLPALVGHTYVLRAISFGRADVLVALRVVRKDTDGSLIIFWRQLADFGKPELDPAIREN